MLNVKVILIWSSNMYVAVEMNCYYHAIEVPHRGLPPCRGGGAYAPMTRMII